MNFDKLIAKLKSEFCCCSISKNKCVYCRKIDKIVGEYKASNKCKNCGESKENHFCLRDDDGIKRFEASNDSHGSDTQATESENDTKAIVDNLNDERVATLKGCGGFLNSNSFGGKERCGSPNILEKDGIFLCKKCKASGNEETELDVYMKNKKAVIKAGALAYAKKYDDIVYNNLTASGKKGCGWEGEHYEKTGERCTKWHLCEKCKGMGNEEGKNLCHHYSIESLKEWRMKSDNFIGDGKDRDELFKHLTGKCEGSKSNEECLCCDGICDCESSCSHNHDSGNEECTCKPRMIKNLHWDDCPKSKHNEEGKNLSREETYEAIGKELKKMKEAIEEIAIEGSESK